MCRHSIRAFSACTATPRRRSAWPTSSRFITRGAKGPGPGAYAIDHSAQSYVLDAQGRLRLLVKHDRLGADLAHDLRTLLKEAA